MTDRTMGVKEAFKKDSVKADKRLTKIKKTFSVLPRRNQNYEFIFNRRSFFALLSLM